MEILDDVKNEFFSGVDLKENDCLPVLKMVVSIVVVNCDEFI